MATWDDVRRIALSLPETTEDARGHDGLASWRVKDKMFVWERPLRKSDLTALGDAAPTGALLGVRVADLDDKEAVLAEHADVCFTIPHFSGYAAVLVLLDEIDLTELEELVVDAWLSRAPKRVAAEYVASRR
jgi:hypothetical protein